MKDEQAIKDIDAVLNYLKIYHPEKADRNYAAAFLDYLQSKIHDLALNDPDELEKIYSLFEKN